MKQLKARARSTQHFGNDRIVEIVAYSTKTPGLVVGREVVQFQQAARRSHSKWAITHERSGLKLPGLYRTRHGAMIAANTLNAFDWNRSADEIKPIEGMYYAAMYAHDRYGEL